MKLATATRVFIGLLPGKPQTGGNVMRKLNILGLLVLALACAGCGADEEKKAIRKEIATLNTNLNNLQTRIDKREAEIAELRQFLQDKEPRFVRAQEQLQALEKQIIASEKSTLDKMSGLEEKLKKAHQALANTNKQLAEQQKQMSARDQAHDSADETLRAKSEELAKQTKQLSTRDQAHDSVDESLRAKSEELAKEVAAKKKEIKDIRKELNALKSVVEQQTFQLLQLQQAEELEEMGVTPE